MQSYPYIILFIFSVLFSNSIEATTAMLNPPPCAGEQSSLRWLRYDNLPGWQMDDLYENPFFPQAPDDVRYITSLQTPYNYTNEFGSLVRGYIVAPATGDYVFNVTGDERVNFFLSTTENPEDTTRICYVPRWTNVTEYTKYPEQTSATLSLTAGQYYFFEMHHRENAYNDHAQVYWQTPLNADWQIIHGSYLYDYTCDNICDVQGTPCDDGDPNTNHDTEDGFCNCSGEPITANECVGERGDILQLLFDGISGWAVSNLTSDPSYIANTPTRANIMSQIRKDWTTDYPEFGSVIKGYFSPPMTGIYSFNITGDDQVEFRMSTDDSPANLTTICLATWAVEHDKDPEQTSPDLNLVKGQYYYFEFLHKNGAAGDFYRTFWKAPFLPADKWTKLSPYFFYGNACEMACIPDGVSCDDDDATTENDMYTNCECAGTPCPDNNCETQEGGAYTSYDFCTPTDEHSNNEKDAWMSCTASQNPNVTRGNSHWVRYDFGELKTFTETHVWNYNVANETAKGFRNVVIDYSTDGTSWTHFGTYEWAEASGTNDYLGFVGPNLNGLVAQHILVTGLNNWEDTACRGLSAMTFTVEGAALPLELLSFNAVPEEKAIHLFWEVSQEENLKGYTLQRSTDQQNFRPMTWLAAEGKSYNQYQYLDAQVQANQWYYYRLKMVSLDNRISYSEVKAARLKADGTMVVYPNPSNGQFNLLITTGQAETVTAEVYNISGQQMRRFTLNLQEGLNQQALDLSDLTTGAYWMKIYGQSLNMTERVMIE